MQALHDLSGCIHFHSSLSYDGRVPVPTLVDAAFEAGLDYAILTDHFNLDARAAGFEKTYERNGQRLCFMVGEEISPRYNHYLAAGIQSPILVEKEHPHVQEVIDAVRAQNGLGWIAHPDHEGSGLGGIRAFPWLDWSVTGFDGMSIWDLAGDWARSMSTPLGLLKAWIWPARALHGPAPKTLERWDALCQKTKCTAIGEIDNHGVPKRYFGWKRTVFPFGWAFRTIRTHALVEAPIGDDFAASEKMILSALRRGHSYVSLDLWEPATGFAFEIFNRSGRAVMGDSIAFEEGTLLEIRVPEAGRIRIIRNGSEIYQTSGKTGLEQDVTHPGVYRVEVQQYVWGQWRPWIFSNPIWVQ